LHTSRSRIRRTIGTIPAALTALILVASGQPASAAEPGDAQTTAQLSGTAIGSAPAGKQVVATLSDAPRSYTDAQLAELNARTAEADKITGSVTKGRPGPKPVDRALSPAQPAPGGFGTNTATVLRNSTIPASGIAGGAGFSSSTQEPSTDANGGNIFQTGNWYATRSTNNGATWQSLDPFTLFGPNFCCDQVTQYDPATGRQFWLLQFSDHLVIANASAAGAGAFTSWCFWNITPAWYGLPAGTFLDYHDISITNNNVNIASNFFPTSGAAGSGILRLPKVPMSTCSAFGFNFLTRTDNFTFKLAPGSTDTLFWGSNWGQTNGSSFRVFSWAENSGTYFFFDRTVAAYTFYTRNSGQNCASADGVVANWCQFADSRTLGAFRAGGRLGFSFNARQDASHPFPYTRVVWFDEVTKNYLGAGDQWGTWGAIQFMAMAPNSTGRIGNTWAWGGGTGTTHFFPGAAVNNSPNNGIDTSPNFYLFGSGNPCLSGGMSRWGDYLTVRNYKASPTQWVAAGYRMTANCGVAGAYSEPHNVHFS
jgi:hypothetical protein